MKIYLNTKKINQMNTEFVLKLATLTTGATIMELLKVTTDRIGTRLKEIDQTFSPFEYDSLLAKFQRNDESPLTASNDFQAVYNSAILSEQMTNGIYKPYFAGKFDPSLIVKNWAVEQIFNDYLKPLLHNPNIIGIYIDSDGSQRFATKQESDFNWPISIENVNGKLLSRYYLKNGAISTTIQNKSLRNNKSDVKQATIIRNSLVEAAVWSQAATTTDISTFESFITHYNLTGILSEKDGQNLNFNLGNILNKEGINYI